MKYIELSIPKATLILTENEILQLIKQDTELFAIALKRGKAFKRSEKQREREKMKDKREDTQ